MNTFQLRFSKKSTKQFKNFRGNKIKNNNDQTIIKFIKSKQFNIRKPFVNYFLKLCINHFFDSTYWINKKNIHKTIIWQKVFGI